MRWNRRQVLGLFGAALAALSVGGTAWGRPHPRRRWWRHHRAVVRRRIRRRALWRWVHGHRVLVVPLALAVGWELLLDDDVVVVTRIEKDVEDGEEVEYAVIEHEDGRTERVRILREDNAENAEELEGSVLDEDEDDVPYVEDED